VIHWYYTSRFGDKRTNILWLNQHETYERNEVYYICKLNLNQQSRVWLLLIMLWIINGSSFLAIKVAIDTIPPLLSGGLRFAISGAFLFAVFYFRGERKNHLYQAEVNRGAAAAAPKSAATKPSKC
jgi:hypothetical protein